MSESSRKVREQWSYDVFLNFRGPDVRKGFLSFLCKSLATSGIYPFIDNGLERGEIISPSLSKAIEDSKILLVVLSKSYASSPWCLDELAHIMKCRQTDSGHIVLPVFYDVEPADVRHLRGSFGKFFDFNKSRYPLNKLQKWKDALYEVSALAGFVKYNFGGNDADFVEELTNEIVRRTPSSYLHLPTYAVGIRSRAHDINELMCFGLNDVRIIGICGMGGIGKTTLAKAVYNESAHLFEGTSFLEHFGEHFKKPEGKVQLQRQLLSDILRRRDMVFDNTSDHEVKHRFRNKRVLVVVDDVEDMKQLNSAAIDLSCFGPGSRIIITSRNKHLLEQLGVLYIYSPELFDDVESLKLVSLHAFRKSEPPVEFRQLSEKFVEYCGGLPLAIEILAAFLFKRNISEWKSTLKSLKRIPNNNIQAKLRISYDALDALQKDIFLDISCFFIGMDKDYVDCILDGCELDPGIGLNVLKERCLITVHDNRLMMHDLLRDMGRQIVRGKYRNNCEKWSRLWDPNNVIDVLTNHTGTDAIEGLSLKAEVAAAEVLEVKAFSNLRKLRLLQLSRVSLNGSYGHFPKGLRWLCWFNFPLDSLPTNFHLGSVVVMDLQYSNLKRFWYDQKQPQFLKRLKYLDLSHSVHLIETPDFTYLPNLEKLLLINCEKLVIIHKSIGSLHKNLVLLNLEGCTDLGDLPLEIYTLKSLETLILSGCSQVERLDDALGELESLTTLKANSTALTQLPSSINQVKKLEKLSLDGCKDLWKDKYYTHSENSPRAALRLPFSLNGLSCLKTLHLGSCNLSDEMFPENLGSFPCLEEIELGDNNFHNLQTDFAGLPNLQIIRVDGCSELQSMLSLPKLLRSLHASNCIELERTPDLTECTVLQSLHLTNCLRLVETPGLDQLKTVGVIHMEMCIRVSDTYRERIMQGWAVGANGGIFIPGSSVPNWVSFKNEANSVSFMVPEVLNPDLNGFTLWATYASQQDNVMCDDSPKITVKNQTKGSVWSRNPATDQIRMYREKHIWQGHFVNIDALLEPGNQVEVSLDFGNQVTILEIGLTLAYREVTEIQDEQLKQIDDEVDNVVVEEIQHRPPSPIPLAQQGPLFSRETLEIELSEKESDDPLIPEPSVRRSSRLASSRVKEILGHRQIQLEETKPAPQTAPPPDNGHARTRREKKRDAPPHSPPEIHALPPLRQHRPPSPIPLAQQGPLFSGETLEIKLSERESDDPLIPEPSVRRSSRVASSHVKEILGHCQIQLEETKPAPQTAPPPDTGRARTRREKKREAPPHSPPETHALPPLRQHRPPSPIPLAQQGPLFPGETLEIELSKRESDDPLIPETSVRRSSRLASSRVKEILGHHQIQLEETKPAPQTAPPPDTGRARTRREKKRDAPPHSPPETHAPPPLHRRRR